MLFRRDGSFWNFKLADDMVAGRDSMTPPKMREYEREDYSVVVKNRGTEPNPWAWEIYRAGRSGPIKKSPVLFSTMAKASKAGKEALNRLLETLFS